MKPRSLSATALQTANLCMARYGAENIKYGRGIENNAAMLGTSCHNALELYVKQCYLSNKEQPTLKLLLEFYKLSYMETFSTSEASGDMYDDGVDMLTRWFKRTDFSRFEVVSAETKTSFPVPTSAGDIPFNYIWDRHDMDEDGNPKVVDYKTNRMPETTESLRKKVQARCYGLAAQIMYPKATKIWIEFDMLRHDGPVAVSFSREDNIATWRFIRDTAERILAADPARLPETLNEQCLFCVRKGECKAIRKNIEVEGVFGRSVEEMVDVRAELSYQAKAVKAALDEIDSVILGTAEATDVLEYESASHTLEVSSRRTRTIDSERAELVLGPELFGKYGSSKITLTSVQKILKTEDLTEEQKKQLNGLITFTYSSASVKTAAKSSI